MDNIEYRNYPEPPNEFTLTKTGALVVNSAKTQPLVCISSTEKACDANQRSIEDIQKNDAYDVTLLRHENTTLALDITQCKDDVAVTDMTTAKALTTIAQPPLLHLHNNNCNWQNKEKKDAVNTQGCYTSDGAIGGQCFDTPSVKKVQHTPFEYTGKFQNNSEHEKLADFETRQVTVYQNEGRQTHFPQKGQLSRGLHGREQPVKVEPVVRVDSMTVNIYQTKCEHVASKNPYAACSNSDSNIPIASLNPALLGETGVITAYDDLPAQTLGNVDNNVNDLTHLDQSYLYQAGKPEVNAISPTEIRLRWQNPYYANQFVIIHYCIRMHYGNGLTENIIFTCVTRESQTTFDMECYPEIEFRATVTAVFAGDICSCESVPSDPYTLKTSPEAIAFAQMMKNSRCVKKGNPRICMPRMDFLSVYEEKRHNIKKYSVGPVSLNKPEKVIMIVGATGSGKTTLINGMINYIFGVKWDDEFRILLIDEGHLQQAKSQSRSQTPHITAYTLHHQPFYRVNYTLTIIDTPGFGDTNGIVRDREIAQEIKLFFSAGGSKGIDTIDAIGFVVQCSLPRLTHTQQYIFDQVLSLFGKDIVNNIFMLLTFADGEKPQVISGLEAAGMPHKRCFKFNNSALFVENTPRMSNQNNSHNDSDSDSDDCQMADTDKFNRLFWEMGEVSFKSFFKRVNHVTKQSLRLTKEVLYEREQIECTIVSLQNEIKKGLNKLEILKKELNVLKTHQADIDRNKNFTYIVEEEKAVQKDIPPGTYITNCLTCNFTCHNPCGLPDDDDKLFCSAMKWEHGILNWVKRVRPVPENVCCEVCPGKCSWKFHKNMTYEITTERIKVVRTANDLLTRYKAADGKKRDVAETVKGLFYEFAAYQMSVLHLTELVTQSIERLKEIALKPNPLSTSQYIDLLIESELSQATAGFYERVTQLRAVRKQAECLENVTSASFDPFGNYMQSVADNSLSLFQDIIKPIVEEGSRPFQDRIEKNKAESSGWKNAFQLIGTVLKKCTDVFKL